MRGTDSNTGLKVNTVTVVGANGTMGRNVSAIFASFGHAKVYMVSRDIKKSEAARDKVCQSVRAESVKNNMYPADYSMLEDCVKESDIVFESSAENWNVKSAVTAQIAEAVAKHMDACRNTVFCTGSSELSITGLSEIFPEELRGNYMGMHMFNPPYSMTLCEMTPTTHSNRELFKAAMEYAAISRLRCGDYDVAIVVGFELMKTVDSMTGGDYLGRAAFYEKEGQGIQLPFPKLFGKLADEYIAKYGLDEQRYLDALARISEINYGNAKRNPLAQTRKWFMDYEQASHRDTETNMLVGGRLGVADCSQVTDGAAVVVLASERYIEEHPGYKENPVVKGFGHRTAPFLFSKKMADNKDSEYVLPWTRQAVDDCYRRSGLTVDDIDCFETHDCFTSSEYAAISAFGLTAPGKEYETVESGLIAFDGKKPINPSGGLIGCGHPVGASGARMFMDIYKQVSGKAGGYQVKDARNAMMLNIGGSATTNYVFVVGRL